MDQPISAEDEGKPSFIKVERLGFFSPTSLKGWDYALWAITFGSQILKGWHQSHHPPSLLAFFASFAALKAHCSFTSLMD